MSRPVNSFFFIDHQKVLYIDKQCPFALISNTISFCSLDVVIGQPTDASDEPAFHGELSHLNLFATTLSQTTIIGLASSCDATAIFGDIISWFECDAYKLADVSQTEPSLCGESDCPPGTMGTLCDITLGREIAL